MLAWKMAIKLSSAINIITPSIVVILLICQISEGVITEHNEILDYFSKDYDTSRNKFLDEARKNNGRIYSFQNHKPGPNDQSLFTDVAIFGTSAPKLTLVLTSGTHGVEGFVGSAIQTGLLRQGIVWDLIPDMQLVMIHAINPYGFAHLRRFNEDNIDLNRNFIDHSKQHPANKGYEQLADVLAPKKLSLWNATKLLAKLLWYRALHGKIKFSSAISMGQYSHPMGLFYGGNTPAWSNRNLRKIANLYLSEAGRVVIIDFHSGLGSYGDIELIMNDGKGSFAYHRAQKWWGNKVESTVSGDSVSANLYGTLKLAFPEMLPKSEVTAVSLEFGTLSRRKVLLALRSENWLHHFGGKNHPKSKKIKQDLLSAFYPDDNEWKIKAWLNGKKIIEEFMDYHK